MTQLDSIRANREIIGKTDTLNAPHIAYLGTFNSTKHWNSMAAWLGNLHKEDIPLLIVDNQSDDDSWLITKELVPSTYPNSVLVRNPINLGGFGSLSLNLDLMEDSEWVTTLHQDDRYPAHHLTAHKHLASKCEKDVAIISSEQESFTPRGARLGYPRASWFLGSEPNPVALFLANLRHHTMPFSGASFRVQMLKDISIPWHSTAFPDTEIVLKMLPSWTGITTTASIVQYLENPNSESHSIMDNEKNLGATMSLIRVFSSSNFGELCGLVEEGDLEAFVEELLFGISTRISEPEAASKVSLVALEALTQYLGPIPIVAKLLEAHYALIGATASASLLHRLHMFSAYKKKVDQESCAEVSTRLRQNPSVESARVWIRHLLARLLGLLPRRARVLFVRAGLQLLHAFKIRTKWHFNRQ
jgi:hypothetical protein